jgi:hypothetical protein
MLSNCPRCGSSLALKEALQTHCTYCSHPLARSGAAVTRLLPKNHSNALRKDLDALRKNNFSPAA